MSPKPVPVTQKPTAVLPQRIIQSDAATFRQKFNRASFQFAHNLAEHPLFQLPRLVEPYHPLAPDQTDCSDDKQFYKEYSSKLPG